MIDKTNYWHQLNQLPKKGVQNIVTDKILKFDKKACARILSNMYSEKAQLDEKRAI